MRAATSVRSRSSAALNELPMLRRERSSRRDVSIVRDEYWK
jgi:hypothetical protein